MRNKYGLGPIRVNDRLAFLSVLVGVHGKVVRYWVRRAQDNVLLAVGDLDGPLPLDVAPIHGR
ncbi:MAG: hypothetical protein IH617_13450 [Hydrogenophaga sp.]|nr:hypothetical protein [Hydrogenophaga sp.]